MLSKRTEEKGRILILDGAITARIVAQRRWSNRGPVDGDLAPTPHHHVLTSAEERTPSASAARAKATPTIPCATPAARGGRER